MTRASSTVVRPEKTARREARGPVPVCGEEPVDEAVAAAQLVPDDRRPERQGAPSTSSPEELGAAVQVGRVGRVVLRVAAAASREDAVRARRGRGGRPVPRRAGESVGQERVDLHRGDRIVAAAGTCLTMPIALTTTSGRTLGDHGSSVLGCVSRVDARDGSSRVVSVAVAFRQRRGVADRAMDVQARRGRPGARRACARASPSRPARAPWSAAVMDGPPDPSASEREPVRLGVTGAALGAARKCAASTRHRTQRAGGRPGDTRRGGPSAGATSGIRRSGRGRRGSDPRRLGGRAGTRGPGASAARRWTIGRRVGPSPHGPPPGSIASRKPISSRLPSSTRRGFVQLSCRPWIR